MFTTIKRGLALLPLLLTTQAGTAWASSSPIGVWFDHTGRGAVEITDCNGALCGRIVWVKSASNQGACDTQILGNLKPVGGGKWDRGWIYNPENKSKYDVELTPLGDDKLKVLGYAGTKLFSRSMTWTRAPADLVKCGKAVAATATAETAKPNPAAEPRASDAPAKTIERESKPVPTAPVKEAAVERPLAKDRDAPTKETLCTVRIRELGSFSFPCPRQLQ